MYLTFVDNVIYNDVYITVKKCRSAQCHSHGLGMEELIFH